MSYQLVEDLQKKAVSVTQSCRVLQVSRSGFYDARSRAQATLTVCATSVKLKTAFACSGYTYGSRRLRTALATQGLAVGRHRIRSLMKKLQLRPVWKRKFVNTTNSKHDLPVSPNVLNRQFEVAGPNQAWVCDITYIRTRRGWLYLAAVMDLYARKIVGWACGKDMPAQLVCAALQMAIAARNPPPGLIVHSDRGSQYASALHQALLVKHQLVGSMSRKGNCWDNAVMERFFLNLKMERVWQRDYANHEEAMADVADYIVGFYNSVRLHSKLGNLPPNAFEQQRATQQPIDVSENT
jgi:putative transposase